jgi:hypothetical protein
MNLYFKNCTIFIINSSHAKFVMGPLNNQDFKIFFTKKNNFVHD